MDRPDPQPKSADPSSTAFRASTYGHRWSQFDPSVGKTVWQREAQKKKRRRSVDIEPYRQIHRNLTRSASPPRPPAAAEPQVLRTSRDPKMEIRFVLNQQQPPQAEKKLPADGSKEDIRRSGARL